jgi:hypothetical protein
VGIAAELGELGQANFPGQDAAVGEARVGREIGAPRAPGESREIPPGWPAGWRRGRGIGHAGAGVGESQVALRVPMGVSRWWLRSGETAASPARRSGVADHRGSPRYGQPHLAVGMLGVGGHKGGQGGAGIPWLSSRSTEPEEKCRALWPEAISRSSGRPRPGAGPPRGPPCRRR